MLKNIVDFWSAIFKPDAEVTISNEAVSKYVNNLIKRSLFKIIAESKKPYVIMDEDISRVLKIEVFYIGMGTKMNLIKCINKNCGLDIDPYTQNIKLVMDGKELLFIQTTRLHNNSHYTELQMYHFFKTIFLAEGEAFDPYYKYSPSALKGFERYKRAMSALLREI